MILKFIFTILIAGVFSQTVFASSSRPNLQEMHALHEQELVKQQKQQQAGIFKKQRDELLANYKALLRAKDDAYNQMKVSERDYKTATARVNSSLQEQAGIENQIMVLRKNKSAVEKKQLQAQLQALSQAQTKIAGQMSNFSKIQQASYENMQMADAQFRNLTAKEQILKQQIDSVQRQLQFVLSQP